MAPHPARSTATAATAANAEHDGTSGEADTDPGDPNDGPGGGGGAGNTGGHGGLAFGAEAWLGDAYSGGSLMGGQGGHADGIDGTLGGAGGGGGGGLIGGGGGAGAGGSTTYGSGGGGGGGGEGGVKNGATLVFTNDAANLGDGLVAITYTVAADILASPSSQDFGTWSVPGSQTESFRVTNTGSQPLNIDQASITLADANRFQLVSGADDCSHQTLAAGDSCLLQVRFAPDATRHGRADGCAVHPLQRVQRHRDRDPDRHGADAG